MFHHKGWPSPSKQRSRQALYAAVARYLAKTAPEPGTLAAAAIGLRTLGDTGVSICPAQDRPDA